MATPFFPQNVFKRYSLAVFFKNIFKKAISYHGCVITFQFQLTTEFSGNSPKFLSTHGILIVLRRESENSNSRQAVNFN